MAIENTNIPTPVNPTLNEDEQDFVTVQEAMAEVKGDFEMQEDGSAVLSPEDTFVPDTSFDSNLAESLDEDILNRIANDLIDGINKDKSSRQDWESTYVDGLKYLGMKFDDERSEPFQGASGVIHPLLGEAVTNFQAQAYKELLPAGGPVKTQVIGMYDSAVE